MEFFSAPFWSIVSTRFRQAKNILLMALLSWIVFTVAIGLINPPPHSCWREMNATHQSIERVGYQTTTTKMLTKHQVKRQSVTLPVIANKIIDEGKDQILNKTNPLRKSTVATTNRLNKTARRRKTTTTTTSKPDIYDEDDDAESEEEDNPINEQRVISNKKPTSDKNVLHVNTPQKTIGNPLEITVTNLSLVKPLASPVLYEQKDVRNVFMVFLLLIIIGEFFSAPAITLAV